MSESDTPIASFGDLSLPAPLLRALNDVGYETPSPIQARTIPVLLQGRDLLGHAPTGTGKTAAFALPLLARLDLNAPGVQLLVLTPTRELAIQVAEAFAKYARHLDGLKVLPVYGGQEYGTQIRQLNRGVQVVVGTPGRVMDHMRKGTLKLGKLQALVLDEADEMLRMGFIEDVQWILQQTPDTRQTALFSATMPKEVQKIAQNYLNKPEQITVKGKAQTAETIRQRYWPVSGMHKLDALTRILEFETFAALLVFVRTRIATTELSDRLEARGYAVAAINGDMPQKQREQTIERLKNGTLDILVATDVAARGLDVDRISHVINYDIPYDTESYIHRIGRTGRAGRTGDAILFVSPREKRMLSAIERATRQKIDRLTLPSTEMVNNKRIGKFKQGITDTMALGDLDFMRRLVEQYQDEHDVPVIEIAAALAKQAVGDRPLLLKHDKDKSGRRDKSISFDDTGEHNKRERRDKRSKHDRPDRPGRRGDRIEKRMDKRAQKRDAFADDYEQFRLEVGTKHGAQAGNIVGAIANESGLDSEFINRVKVMLDHSLVSLPAGMPNKVFKDLKKAWVCGQRLEISRVNGKPKAATDGPHPAPGDKPKRKNKNKIKHKNKNKDKNRNAGVK